MPNKNIKISAETHTILKKFCDETGYRMGKYIEILIQDNCKSAIKSTKRILLVD